MNEKNDGKTETRELTRRITTIRDLFVKKSGSIQSALGNYAVFDDRKLIETALSVIRGNPDLLKCSAPSLLHCLVGCAQLQLNPEPALGQAYFVPFWNRKKGMFEAQLIPGYRGYIALARRTGEVESFSADVVYRQDELIIEKGLDDKLVHRPNYAVERDTDENPVVGAYCVIRYLSGARTFDYMPRSEIDGIRKRSKASDRGPWVTDYNEMAKKTVIRRHVKTAPLSISDMARAAHAEDLALSGKSQEGVFDDMIEVGGEDADQDTQRRIALDRFDSLVLPDEKNNVEKWLKESADATGKSVEELKVEIVESDESIERAISVFRSWMDGKKGSKSKPRGGQKDRKKTEGDDKQGGEKSDSAGPDKPGTSGSGRMPMNELVQTDIYQELQVLAEKKPTAYKAAMAGKKLSDLRSPGQIEKIVAEIEVSDAEIPEE